MTTFTFTSDEVNTLGLSLSILRDDITERVNQGCDLVDYQTLLTSLTSLEDKVST